MKILIAEQDQLLLDKLVGSFKKEGYHGERVHNYRDAYRKLNNFEYDIVLLDIGLPGGDVYKLIRMIRKDDVQMGIIVLASGAAVEDKVKALNYGADDVVAVPFHIMELKARMRAVMRRKTGQYTQELNIGGLKILLEQRKALIRGVALSLTKKEYEILLFLARNKNRVISKEKLAEHLWGDYMDEAVSFDFMYAHIKNLRRKLSEHGVGDLLKTIYGVGYKLENG
jgi:DNA-binding response OmpR family regulator